MNKILKSPAMIEMAKNASDDLTDYSPGCLEQPSRIPHDLACRLSRLGIIMVDGITGLTQEALEDFVAKEEEWRGLRI